jgi:hypothetical protein
MPQDIPPMEGAEIIQQIMLKMENLNWRVKQGLVVAFADVVNRSEDEVSSK